MRSTDDDDSLGPVIRDRRRIDPVTGQVRGTGQPGAAQSGPGQAKPGKHSVSRPGGQPGGTRGDSPGGDSPGGAAGGSQPREASGDDAAPAASPAGPASPDDATVRLAERTADLQRLQAEYANYRKRVERDRAAVSEQALSSVLSELLPVLDDIGRAREHGELTGGFKSVAESLEGIVVKLGLTAFGESGEPFDPTLHEALMHSYSADVTEPTAVQILQPGYKVGERIIRPARVAVAEPGDDAPDAAAGPADKADPDASAGGDAPAE